MALPRVAEFVQNKCFINTNWMNLKRKNNSGEQQKWCITNIQSFSEALWSVYSDSTGGIVHDTEKFPAVKELTRYVFKGGVFVFDLF